MTPEEALKLKQRVELLENFVADFVYSDRYIFQKHQQLLDGRNLQLGIGTGTKIATASTQKLGFYGKAPVVQGSAITEPTGGTTIDSEARTAINSIRTFLTSIGLTA